MNEADGCTLLCKLFLDAGYIIVPNYRFTEDGVDVELDGWDASARVGFEYITEEANDARQFTLATLARFEARMAKHELFVLLVDEHDAVTGDALEAAARSFLEHISNFRAKP